MEMDSLKGKNILLGVGGGIAAYKACELLRRLTDAEANVHVVLTSAAQKFVTALTFQSLSQNPVHTDLFNLTEEAEMSHIKLADEADLVLIAPATADLIAKAACGMAGDLLTTALLVTRAPVILAPSMNVNMWEKEIVQQNIRTLKERGCQIIEPDEGYLACGWEGKGRLADPAGIVQAVVDRLKVRQLPGKKKSLQGKKILINAGPTREFIDPVRFISNPSSGKMGYALAEAAEQRGAEVTLVSGPVALSAPAGVRRVEVETAEEMFRACEQNFKTCDIFIASAAVGDYRAETPLKQKLKKGATKISLQLKSNPDILKTLSLAKKNGQVVVGFAAETENLLENSRKKLKEKRLDLIIANEISPSNTGFQSDDNEVVLIYPEGIKKLPRLSKQEIAVELWDFIERELLRDH
jgi:phosphopantothenoylcysteine decarboxylase/phosphopantothenate--cysteine ligase